MSRSQQVPAVVKNPHWAALSWLAHGFSTRQNPSGSLSRKGFSLGVKPGWTQRTVLQNRRSFLQAVGAASRSREFPLVSLHQVHSDQVHLIEAPIPETLVGDGLITKDPSIALSVQTADCIPIILLDRKQHAVGVFHAGWRGTLKRIVQKGLGLMTMHFGSKPRNVYAAIGPGIGGCCYEVGEQVREDFQSQFGYAGELFREVQDSDPVREKYPLLFMTARAPGHSVLPSRLYLDLPEANRMQLISAGVPHKNIWNSGFCTNCRPDLLFSHRAEKGRAGRMMAVVAVKP